MCLCKRDRPAATGVYGWRLPRDRYARSNTRVHNISYCIYVYTRVECFVCVCVCIYNPSLLSSSSPVVSRGKSRQDGRRNSRWAPHRLYALLLLLLLLYLHAHHNRSRSRAPWDVEIPALTSSIEFGAVILSRFVFDPFVHNILEKKKLKRTWYTRLYLLIITIIWYDTFVPCTINNFVGIPGFCSRDTHPKFRCRCLFANNRRIIRRIAIRAARTQYTVGVWWPAETATNGQNRVTQLASPALNPRRR